MQTKVHPALALCGECLFLLISAERLGMGSLHGEVHIPSRVAHAPHSSHTAPERFGLHAVGVKEHIAGMQICRIGHMPHIEIRLSGALFRSALCRSALFLSALSVLPGRHRSKPSGFSLLLPGSLTALAFPLRLSVNFILLLQVPEHICHETCA